jgi:hypothetical protein
LPGTARDFIDDYNVDRSDGFPRVRSEQQIDTPQKRSQSFARPHGR